MKIIELKNISKNYIKKDEKIEILKDISISFETSKLYAIIGHSGAGKTTLLNIIGLLDNNYSGDYYLDDKNINNLSNNEKANLRNKKIGFVFQDFLLDDYLTAYENITIPMLLDKNNNKDIINQKVNELLNYVGLNSVKNHFPKELSGGEKQRVSIARALVNNPNIILADEPTGNLDKDNEKTILELLKKLSNEGKCVIIVSHSDNIKNYADIIYKIEDKKIIEEKNV